MTSGQLMTFLAEVGTPHADSPAYQTCPIMASTTKDAVKKASRWAVSAISGSSQPHHVRLVQGEDVVWTRTYGKPLQG